MNKKQRRAAAAAAARALLGLEAGAEAQDSPPEPVALPKSAPASKIRRIQVEAGESEPLPRPSHETAVADARKHGLMQVASATGKIDPKHFPKKHAPGALTRGTSVWYRGERHYVEFCPPTWESGCYARICASRVHPDVERLSGSDLRDKCHANSFCVHADLLSLAPTVKSFYADQPTLAGAARAERTKRGEKDVGDPVAVMLREGKSLDDVYRIGAAYLEVQASDLKAKYAHLNPGQQRMTIGNRMRAKWRKEQG